MGCDYRVVYATPDERLEPGFVFLVTGKSENASRLACEP